MLKSNQKEREINQPVIPLGGGEMGKAIRAFDWSATSLGPLDSWPNSLKTAVNLMLQSPAPLVILWGSEGVTLYNDAYSAFAGGRHPALLGTSCMESWPEAADFVENIVSKCLQGETLSYKRLPYTVYRNNIAENIWLDLDCSPIPDVGGSPGGVFIVNHETTQYVAAEQALKESEARVNLIIKGSTDGIWDLDVETRTAVWNDRFWEILGYSREEVGKPGFDFILSITHPDDKEKLAASFTQTTTGSLHDIIYRVKHRQGDYIYLHSKGNPVLNEQGRVVRVVGITIDITEHKQAEEALLESEKRFRTMAEASGILIAHTDKTGSAVYFNREWLKLTGRTMAELMDHGWVDLLHPDDQQSFLKAYKTAFDRREVLKREFRLQNPEGEYRWQLAVVSPRFGPHGTFAGYVSSCIDVTELKQTQAKLDFQHQLTKTLAENATLGLFMMDAEGRTTFMNPAAEKLSGFTFEEAQGQVLHELIHHRHPDGSPHPMKDCPIGQTVFALGQLTNHEDVFIRKDGSFFPVLCSASAIWENNELQGLILEVQDISERKQAEEDLKKIKIISDHAFDAFILMREDGSFAYLNDLALKRWGYTPKEATHIRVPDVDPIYQEEKFKEAFAQAQKQGALPPFETIHKRKDGTTYPVEVSMGGIMLEGKPHLFAVARDITERKQAEEMLKARNEELQKTNNDLDNFIYTASHDLKAPITNIEGLMHMLLRHLPAQSQESPVVKKVIPLIGDSIKRFKNTIGDLTELTKLQRSAEEDVSQLSLQEIFEEVRLDLQTTIQDTSASFEVDFSHCTSIHFSKKNMRSIMYNLVSNAIKYRDPARKPLVRVSSRTGQDYCLLTVEDNGLGIDLSQESKMFSMFKRLHDHVEGSGVGLYIVKKIVENSGGRIKVESKVGSGSTFKVYFR